MLMSALSAGCNKTPREPVPTKKSGVMVATTSQVGRPEERALPEPPSAREVPGAQKFIEPNAERIVAIGDLHGDFSATRRAFRLAGATDERDRWVGEQLVVVQTGDQLDRGDEEPEILDFLDRLADEAEKAGGRIYVLNGNHETMNVIGDFRYVTPDALTDFGDVQPHSPRAKNIPTAYERRARAFLPGGGMALRFSERPLILMVGDTLFAHGGVLPAHVDYGIDRLNDESASWMRGERATPPAPVMDPDGPLWTRLYGEPSLSSAACATLQRTLDSLSAKRLVVGHTVQANGLSGACQDRVFRIDVGLAHYYGDRPVQVLEIEKDRARILTEK